jgi:dephospho-CoA kinase
MTTSNKIIGIAGTFGSGKDTLANYLIKKKQYYHVSTGDLVRKESLKRHNSIERSPYLQETAEYLRRTFGGGVLVERALGEYQQHKTEFPGVVITGIRSLGEAKAIQSIDGILVYVDAPIEERFKRIQSRKRDKEVHITFEEFKANEQKEATNSSDDESFNIYRIKDMANFVLQNDRDEQSFFDSATRALKI